MTQAPVLSLPDFSIPFILETDASGSAIGAVLQQRGHPLAFFSKALCLRMQRASTYVRKLHAITTAVHKWRQYLHGHSFTILTDHRSWKDLMTPEQQTYLAKLLGYNYNIQYKSGKSNVVVDALSKVPQPEASQYWLLSMPHFIFLDTLQKHFTNSAAFQAKLH